MKILSGKVLIITLFFIATINLVNLMAQVTEEWVARYDAPGNYPDHTNAMVLDGSGYIYVTGISNGYCTTIKYSPEGTEQWVARYDLSLSYGKSIAVDEFGNVYVAGSASRGTLGGVYLILKYNSSGAQQWASKYHGPSSNPFGANDGSSSIALDGLGNIFVTGISEGKESNYDYATIKYNSEGDSLWVKRYNGSGNNYDKANSLAVDGSGNAYVTGYCYIGPGSGTNYDYITIKYSSFGDEMWINRYGGPGGLYDEAKSLALDGSGNVYVTGVSGGAFADYATIKYNSEGEVQWVNRYNGTLNSYDDGRAIAVDGSGNVYVTGYSAGIENSYDYSTVKYNSNGLEQWITRYNGPGNTYDQANAIALDILGNVYVTGVTAIDPNDVSTWDYATIKYNSAGIEQWSKLYNGTGNDNDIANSIAVDASLNIYVTGGSIGSSTGADFTTIKYSPVCSYTAVPTLYISNAFLNGVPITLNCGSTITINHDPLHPQTLEFDVTATDAELPADLITMSAILPDLDCKIVEFNPSLPYGPSNSNIVSHVTVRPNALAGSCSGTLSIFVIDSCGNKDSCKIYLDNPLPVELISFSSSINQGDVTLNWNTASETNNSGFEIERSDVKDGTANDWRKISFVQGNGTNSSPKHYEFTDRNLSSGKYKYRLKQIDFNGNFEYFNLSGEVVIGIPDRFFLSQNYPNPFNPVTSIAYGIPEAGDVKLQVFDMNGREIKTLVNEFKDAGYYTLKFDASGLASGSYVYRIESNNFVSVKKIVFLK
jgi:hypothetical protein